MVRHPPLGTLRRLLDEPVAVPLADERHADHCPRCLARMAAMCDDDAVVSLALGPEPEPDITPAEVALQRFRSALDEATSPSAVPRGRAVRQPGLDGLPAGAPIPRAGAPIPAAGAPTPRLAYRRRRRRLVRPTTLIASALVLTGGATAAAATNLVPIFQPEAVTPVVVKASDLSGLAELSQFGKFSGQRNLQLTPEGSLGALSQAAGFAAPSLHPPAGVATGSPSYWLLGPDQAQVQISVAKIDHAATATGASAPAAPAGVDGSVLRVSTGNGVLEVWGALTLPGLPGSGPSNSGRGSLPGRAGLFGHRSGRSAGHAASAGGTSGGLAAAANSLGGASSLAGEVPTLAVAEVEGPTVSSSGVSLATLEGYLLSQPEISPSLAAEIRAIGDPGSTLPLPVPARGSTSTTDVGGHQAVVYNLGTTAHLVVWASDGRLFAVLGRASETGLLGVARQIA